MPDIPEVKPPEDGKPEQFKAHTLRDVEIFATGRHHGVLYTEKDLDDLVESFSIIGSKIKPPLKLGHNPSIKESPKDFGDGQPALGWVSSVRRVGSKVLATFTDVPEVIAKAINAKLYKRVSIEIYRRVQAEGRQFSAVLTGVALLGADMPEVKTLADLEVLFRDSSFKGSGSERALVSFAVEDGNITHKEDTTMPDTVQVPKELLDKAEQEKAEFSAKATKAEQEAAELKARLAKFEEDRAAEVVKTKRAEFAAFCEDAVKAGKLTPAARDILVGDGKVSFSVGAEPVITLEAFKAVVETFTAGPGLGEKGSGHKPEPKSENPSKELYTKALEYQAAHKVDYPTAAKAVFAANPELAKAYAEYTNKED